MSGFVLLPSCFHCAPRPLPDSRPIPPRHCGKYLSDCAQRTALLLFEIFASHDDFPELKLRGRREPQVRRLRLLPSCLRFSQWLCGSVVNILWLRQRRDVGHALACQASGARPSSSGAGSQTRSRTSSLGSCRTWGSGADVGVRPTVPIPSHNQRKPSAEYRLP
jgi:hypothetical protein